METPRRWLAIGAIIAQPIFVAGWLVAGWLEGHHYSSARQDISDLAALTAHHATMNRVTLGVSGILTIVFALDLLRRVLDSTLAGVLVALSLPGLDNLSDTFFRLDCRAADAGCSAADAASSWHGKIHVIAFIIAAVATIAAPWVLARRMRAVDGWHDLAGKTRAFGVLTIVVLVASGVTTGTAAQGTSQRVAAVIVVSGLAALAWQVHRRTRSATMTA
jgi:hypothetical protein